MCCRSLKAVTNFRRMESLEEIKAGLEHSLATAGSLVEKNRHYLCNNALAILNSLVS